MKKVWTLLCMLVVLFSINIHAFAGTDAPELEVECVNAKPGETINVPIIISNNIGICGAVISISYDERLVLKEISEGDAFSSMTLTLPGSLSANPVKMVWDSVDVDYTNGTIAILTFLVPEEVGVYSISASYREGDVVNGELNPVKLSILNGTVDVSCDTHRYNDGEITEEPTCIKEGLRTYTCNICGYQYTESVAAKGHSYEKIVANPTCMKSGFTTYTCSYCGDSYKDTYVDALGHTYGEWKIVKEAACTEAGEKEHSCEICGLKESVAIEPTGHIWNDGIISTEPECENVGVKLYTCTICGETRTEAINAKGHTIVTDEAKEPDCTEHGFTEGSHCSVCGAVLRAQEEIPAIGHQYSEWKIVEKATCIGEGQKERICSICGEKEAEVIEALGHKWNDGIIMQKATEQANGVKIYTCRTCGEVKTEIIPKIKTEPLKEDMTTPSVLSVGTVINDVDSGTFYKVLSSGTVEYQKLNSKYITQVIIPDKVVLNGVSFKVTSIAPNALKNKKSVTAVTIGRNIKTIGNNAFAGCSRLKKITIRKNVISIGTKAFYNCRKLSKVIIEGKALKTIKARAFTGTSAKMKVIFRSSKVTPKKRLALVKKMKKAGMSKSTKMMKYGR